MIRHPAPPLLFPMHQKRAVTRFSRNSPRPLTNHGLSMAYAAAVFSAAVLCTKAAAVSAYTFLLITTRVPLPGRESTSSVSIKLCITENPMPLRSISGWVV